MTVCVCTTNNCNVNVSTCTMGYNFNNVSQPTTSGSSVALASTLSSTPDISTQHDSTRTTSRLREFTTTKTIRISSEPTTSVISRTLAIAPKSTVNSSTQVGLTRATALSLQFTKVAISPTIVPSANSSITSTRLVSTPTRSSCSPGKAINPIIIGESLILAPLLIK